LKLRWTLANNDYKLKTTQKGKSFFTELIPKPNKTASVKSALPNLQLEAENTTKHYFYLIGQRKNARQAEVIFPADAQQSAYLCIVGNRVFPREKPLNQGKQAAFAQIIALSSKYPLVIDTFCASINLIKKGSLTAKVQTMLGSKLYASPSIKLFKDNLITLNTDSTKQSVAMLTFDFPTEPILPIPTLKQAQRRPIDSLVVRCANIKTTSKNISFDLAVRTSKHPDWNGYLNNLDLVIATDPNVVGYDDLASRMRVSAQDAFAKAKYNANITDLERGTVLLRLTPKTRQRTFLDNAEKTVARVVLPIDNCLSEPLRISILPSGGSPTATYSLQPEAQTAIALKYRKFGLRDAVIKLRCAR
jgi:hypothetical protein